MRGPEPAVLLENSGRAARLEYVWFHMKGALADVIKRANQVG